VEPAGIYLHLPFCASRCSYCAFTTVTDHQETRAEYCQSLAEEIRRVARHGRSMGGVTLPAQHGRRISTVYLGGGTPSLLTHAQMEQVLAAIHDHFILAEGAEVTLEANPETVTCQAAKVWRALGVNRVSLGAQSFRDPVLRALGRRHDGQRIGAALRQVRQAGIRQVSLDIIAGVQGDHLLDDLRQAAALAPDHLSMYLLELDEDEVGGVTNLARRVQAGRAHAPDEDWFAAVYPRAVEQLARAGLARYEISNFARPGCKSQHNLRYWRCQDVLGFGVASHSLVAGERHGITRDLSAYLAAVRGGKEPALERDSAGLDQRTAEAWILGLRLDEGVSVDEIVRRTGNRSALPPMKRLARAISAGLLVRQGDRLRLTARGVLLSNEVFQAFLP
jgi:oxygen-independent coproporphyrinogen-3 oxidase